MTRKAFDKIAAAAEHSGKQITKRTSNGFRMQCPAHDGDGQSVSVFDTESRVNLVCHSQQCESDDILDALGLTWRDRYDADRVDYRYDDGRVVHRSTGEKRFWQSGNKDAQPILYRREKVAEQIAQGKPVLLVEGEEDVHAAEVIGAVAVTAPQGAANFGKVDATPLTGATVVAVVDRDEQGDKWAASVREKVGPIAAELRFAQAKTGKDLSDHLTAGHTLAELAPYAGEESSSPQPADGAALLADVRAWFARYVRTVSESDLDLVTVWCVHTHLAREGYTTGRLLIDSPMPGSGKTTLLDHLQRLCFKPVQMSTVSSTALLVRLIEVEPRTLLVDEVDRSLRPDNPMTPDLLAVLNSGYRVGSTRPVLVPVKGGGWEAQEMSTFAPVAMAGNAPNLPDDTRSRCIRLLLVPDYDGTVEESDWQMIEADAQALAERIAEWAEAVRGTSALLRRPVLPDGVIGRFREKWSPLRMVADAAGGRWPAIVDELALADVEQYELDKEDGAIREAIGLVLLRHLAEVWPVHDPEPNATKLAERLAATYPEVWGDQQGYGRSALSATRLGKMLSTKWGVNSVRSPGGSRRRYYDVGDLVSRWQRMGITPPDTSDTFTGTPPNQVSLVTQAAQVSRDDRDTWDTSDTRDTSNKGPLEPVPNVSAGVSDLTPEPERSPATNCGCGLPLLSPAAKLRGSCTTCNEQEASA